MQRKLQDVKKLQKIKKTAGGKENCKVQRNKETCRR